MPRAYQIAHFGLDGLERVERPSPPLGPHEVRLAMRAASLNYRDVLVLLGLYNPRLPLPLVPLSDGVGIVAEVGSAVRRVKVGDRVAGIFAQGWLAGDPDREQLRTTLGAPLDGMLRSEVVLGEEGVVRVPAHLSDAEAATLPCAGVTAFRALVDAKIRPGDVVLVQGTGGVALFGLQLAKCFGATVIVTSKSDEKLARARALGADHAINYRTTPEWGAAAKALTGGRGVDLVLELGGAATLKESLKAVRISGTIALIGNLGGGTGEVNLLSILMQNVRVLGTIVGGRDLFEAMNRAIAAHGLRPAVDRVVPFSDAPAAFAALGQGEHFGKIAIALSE